jgi:radical SAM protein with 4Fe4S-binding SPASM domain
MQRIQLENRIPLEPNLPLSTPWVIFVDPSISCNLQCKFCYHSSNNIKGIMKWDLYKKIISDIKLFEFHIKTLRLYTFGEPLLNPKFVDMVKYAKDEQIAENIDTTTNGSLFNPKLNLKIIEAGIDRINISVIGINAEQYKSFSNYSINFEKYVDNIAHLYHHRKQCIIFIKINGDVISKEDQQKFLQIFTSISDGVGIEHTMGCWYDFDMKGTPTNKEVGVYGQPISHVEICPYILYSYCVQFNGEVSACFLDWNRKLIIGDVKEQSLIDIWNSNRMNNLRKLMLKMLRFSHPICKSCQQLISGEPVNLDEYSKDLLRRYGFEK